VGIPIGRIEKEFILSAVRDKGMPVDVHGDKKLDTAKVFRFDSGSISLVKEDGDFSPYREEEPIRIFFSYYGHTMTFESFVEKTERSLIQIRYPKLMIKNLERKYERVPPPEGAKASFVIQGQQIVLDFPRSRNYEPLQEPVFNEDFDVTSIQKLTDSFRSKIGRIAEDNRIRMFRDNEPETFEEKCITRFGRVLYIPDTNRSFSQEEMYGSTRIISRDMLKEVLIEEGTNPNNVHLRMSAILTEKSDEGIFSEIYCPILFQDYVTGYIYLMNGEEKRKGFSEELVDYVSQFSKVLAYSLKLHGYFKGEEPMAEEYVPEIVDVSASGMLFAHPSPHLADQFGLYTDFDLILTFENRKMTIPSRVMRKFSEEDLYYYGILFLEIQPEDFRYLFDYIYGREFTSEDENRWEGGAPPPELDLFED
jgi:hypothetical protein